MKYIISVIVTILLIILISLSYYSTFLGVKTLLKAREAEETEVFITSGAIKIGGEDNHITSSGPAIIVGFDRESPYGEEKETIIKILKAYKTQHPEATGLSINGTYYSFSQ